MTEGQVLEVRRTTEPGSTHFVVGGHPGRGERWGSGSGGPGDLLNGNNGSRVTQRLIPISFSDEADTLWAAPITPASLPLSGGVVGAFGRPVWICKDGSADGRLGSQAVVGGALLQRVNRFSSAQF